MQQLEAFLILVRHGTAQDSNVNIDRPLTDEESNEIEQVQLLSSEKLSISQIYHSGILRAMQTAEIIQKRVGSKNIKPLNQLQKRVFTNSRILAGLLRCANRDNCFVKPSSRIGQILMEASLYSNFDFPTAGTVCLKKNFR